MTAYGCFRASAPQPPTFNVTPMLPGQRVINNGFTTITAVNGSDSTTPHSPHTTADTTSDDTDSEPLDLSQNCDLPQPRSSTPKDAPAPKPTLVITKRKADNSDNTMNAKRRHITPTPCKPPQCAQNDDLPLLDFNANVQWSYAKMHNYLKICNCPKCIKALFNHKIKSRNVSKCQCHTCQSYWFYEGENEKFMATANYENGKFVL